MGGFKKGRCQADEGLSIVMDATCLTIHSTPPPFVSHPLCCHGRYRIEVGAITEYDKLKCKCVWGVGWRRRGIPTG